jgi:hypothetical protein
VSLRYEPSDGCPARRIVIEQLAARGVRVDDGDTSDRLSIEVHTVSPEITSLRGELVVEAPNRAPASREVVGQDCNAIVLSLVLVAALAMSPPAEVAPAASTTEPERPRADHGRHPVWLVGVGGRGMTAISPSLALGAGISIERAWDSGPSIAFSAAAFFPPTATTPSVGSADFRAYLGRLAACWWFGAGLGDGRIFLSPCAGMEGGPLVASGSVASPRTATRVWVAPLLDARMLARVTRGVWLSAGGSAFFPLVRDTFVFNRPNALIYSTPVAGAGAELGVAGAFW